MDHYSTLGVGKNATQDEIKQAYKRLAKQHHPDTGGDTEKFAKINQAYETLKDPNKRAEYDNPRPEVNFNSQNFNDVFESFFGRRNVLRKNADLSISIKVTLEDVMLGKDVIGKYRLNSGREEVANIKIPPGIEHGVIMRYKGLGDDAVSSLPRGDLHVRVLVEKHNIFERDRLNLKTKCAISVLDLILGTEIKIQKLGGGPLSIKIPPGTNPGTILSVAGYGLPDFNSGKTGNLYLEIKGITPKIDNYEILEKVKQIYDELNSST
jgi:DnaJ-class molecular chaperone